MNELTRPISQMDICAMQDLMRTKEQVDLHWEHLFADGVYLRVMHSPADTFVVGKCHRTRHFCILLQGTLTVTMDDGIPETITAPHIMVTPPGKKKMLYMVTDTIFANIHPTDTEDIDDIENRIIMPEEEYQNQLGYQASRSIT